jgi:hypothetical protein
MHSSHYEKLRILKRLIRVGLPFSTLSDHTSDSTAVTTLEADITELLTTLRKGIERAEVADLLQYKTLEAEFEYSFGKPGTAGRELEDCVEKLGLRARLERCVPDGKNESKNPFKDKSDDSRSLRQKIWALMGVAYYRNT